MFTEKKFKSTLNLYRKRVEQGIEELIPPAVTPPSRLHGAMRYSLGAGGKRLRPVLLLATADLFDPEEDPVPAAVALECVHTYSLVHDDLPGMDDSSLRRGKPTCHTHFDEATAILAGDALLTYAFELLGKHYRHTPALGNALIRDLSIASGSRRLIGGQMEDLLGERTAYTSEQLENIHLNKTAALITAAMTMGARISHAPEREIQSLVLIGKCVGLTFQIIDDILDATSDDETLGKPAGSDQDCGKATYIDFFGLEGARAQAGAHTEKAKRLCRELPGDSTFLLELIAFLEHRIR